MTHDRDAARDHEHARPRPAHDGESTHAGVDSPALAARGQTALQGVGNRAVLGLMRSGALRRKARVSEPGDALEREADRAADAVVADTSGRLAAPGGVAEPMIQAKDSGTARPARASAQTHELLGDLDAGRPLPDGVRGFMESRFATSFDDVRVHAGERSAAAAESVSARAFTVGSDIVFGAGQFAAESTEGRRLLAHELSHVVQQRPPKERTGATEAGRDGAAGVRARGARGEIQRAPDGKSGTGEPVLTLQRETVSVNFHLMATPEAAGDSGVGLSFKGTHWDPVRRVYTVSFEHINRMRRWRVAPNAEADARADNLEVVLVSTGFTGSVTAIIGARQPAKPSQPAQPDRPPSPDAPRPDPQAVPPANEDPQPADPKHVDTRPEPRGGATKVERDTRTDPKQALNEAAALPTHELRSLAPGPRTRLLDAAADSSRASLPPSLVHDLIRTTPDADAGALADTLHADGDRLLGELQRNQPDAHGAETLDAAVKDLDARRRDSPSSRDDRDIVDWTPAMQKKADEVRAAIQRIGSRKPDVNESMEGRPEWDGFKGRQQGDLERELRNVEREVTRWNAGHTVPGFGSLDDAGAIGAGAHDEVAKALEKVRAATTIKELFEARKAAKLALFRANEAMDAKVKLEQFESGVRLWNQAQGGFAALASVPSHGLAGVSSDEPDKIAAKARAEVQIGLQEMAVARTPEEVAAATTRLRGAIAAADFYLSFHKEQVYGGAEKTIVGIKVVGVTAAAVVAPEYVIPGFFIGGGLGVARQEVQMSEGARKEFDASEAFDNAVVGGFAAPFAVGIPAVGYGMVGLGLGSAASEYSQGHTRTGTFDLVTSLVPLGLKAAGGKNLLPTGRSLRSGALALTLRGVGAGFEDVPGLGGRNPTVGIPYEQGIGAVAETRGTGASATPPPVVDPTPSTAVPPTVADTPRPGAPSVWRGLPDAKPYSPYNINYNVRIAPQAVDPVDAAFAPDARYDVGNVNEVNRVRTTGSGRTLQSLDAIPLSPAERAAARGVHGQLMPAPQQSAWANAANAREAADMAEVNRLWNSGTAEDQQAARVLAREVFDRHRGRYWAAVRRDPQLRATFEATGMRFTGGTTSAPIYDLPDGTVARMTLEHSTRLADNPTQALNGGQLQFVLDDENSVFLEFLRAMDPFQP